ncbi:MAG TPA: 2-oxo-4-hydroxy-4-carboxy-5-ureidoimidazoline decarboxylase [Verrucomicrobiae bacterium]
MSESSRLPTVAEINTWPLDTFVRIFGGVFEHSPWVAGEAWRNRPFADLPGLHQALCQVVQAAGVERQLVLIRAHPDLVGRLALAGQLTRESLREQASAGLDRLTEAEIEAFQQNNAAYQARFGFPFIICARLNKKQAILEGFARRLQNAREAEIKTALEEIYKIAELRLRDLITP